MKAEAMGPRTWDEGKRRIAPWSKTSPPALSAKCKLRLEGPAEVRASPMVVKDETRQEGVDEAQQQVMVVDKLSSGSTVVEKPLHARQRWLKTRQDDC